MDIRTEGVQAVLGGSAILKGVDIQVGQRELVGIIGPNGSGKSTLLKCIYRVLKPTGGAVLLDGRDLDQYSYRESARRIAVVAQHNYYNFEFSVQDVVMMGRAPHKRALDRDNADDFRLVAEALELVGMSGFARRSFSTLSGGEQQRVILARALVEVLGRVFPPDYITVAEGGREEAEALVDKPFDVIFFTGSPAVGKKVMAAAAEHLTPVTLELGGRSPVILAPDADVELAAARIAWGKFLNAGQTCVAPDHVWVPEGMAEPFVAALARQITRFYGANPLAGEELPRIVNRRHFDRLAGLLSGGRIAVGGQTDPEGLRIAPTVLVDVPEGSPVLEEEIFGPILPVLLYRSLPELVEAQRQKPRPLALYLFTRSRSVERAVLEALPFGGGCVNDTVVHLADPRLPFGGVGNSGMGACHGKAGFDAFTHEKSVLKKGRLDIPVRYPPYGKKHLGILKKLM